MMIGTVFLIHTHMIHAGSPGRANQHISHQNALNTSAREKVNNYKAAAEAHSATFCTVDSTAHQSMQAFLRGIDSCSALGKVAEASLNSHQLGACPRGVCGGSADPGLREHIQRSSRFEDGEGINCHSLSEVIECTAVFLS